MAQTVSNLPAMQETQVQSLGWENPLEKEMVTDTSILPGKPHGLHIPWNSLGQNTGLGSLSLLQGIFLTQVLNPGLLHCRQILYHTIQNSI